jgi:hypothetical protein
MITQKEIEEIVKRIVTSYKPEKKSFFVVMRNWLLLGIKNTNLG